MTDHLESPMHPRPQLSRSNWIDLRGVWGFAYDDAERGLEEDWREREDVFARQIVVPFPPESKASGIGDSSFHPVVWYRRTFKIPQGDMDERLILHFGAVDYHASVWVNGRFVADHEGGHTPFFADITRMLHPEGEQVLVVRAEDRPGDLAQPRGKQDWDEQPHDIWYHRTTGIWQPVWIEPVSSSHITDVRWMPDLDRGTLGLTVRLSEQSQATLRVRVRLSLRHEPIVDDTATVFGTELQREITLDLGRDGMDRHRVFWSPGNPNLIDATISVLAGEECVDQVTSYAGLRNVSTAGGRFLLNGRPYYMRMALEQGYWPDTHLAAPSDEALKREVELTKELGFNSVRIHQKVEDPRYLYWCDRLGLMVWGEMANAYTFSRESVERLTREWLAVVERDWSHPCIVAWVPINESWGVPNLIRDTAQQHFVRSLYHLTKALDPTRLVIGNDGWEYIAGDIFGIHDYTFSGDVIRERYGSTERLQRTLREVQPGYRFVSLSGERPEGTPIMLTEFGGISYRPSAADVRWFGYGTVEAQDAFLDKYRELVDAVLDSPPIAGFCYTQITDTVQEKNGLLTEDREFKLDPVLVRAINQRAPLAVPGEMISQMQKTKPTPFATTVEPPPTGDEEETRPSTPSTMEPATGKPA